MTNGVKEFPILRINRESRQEIKDKLAQEYAFTIILNNQELVTLLCSPMNLKYLAVGFLFSEGFVKNKEEVKKMTLNEQRGVAYMETSETIEPARDLFKRLITSSCGRGVTFYSTADAQSAAMVSSRMKISANEVFALINEFQLRSRIYRETGGVHGSALCDTKNILVFSEDIGRHNAIDKVFGECILKNISVADRIIITSGRISSEALLKVVRRNISIVASISAATDMAVNLAADLGVTLIGFVRGRRMNVYTNSWRVS
ncbi:MAG: Sulfurtransferase FdhD [Syntrophomonadaceae bacterium]|nr:Sulfurtransferase FdhD [Bacillota bacterium]